MNTHLSEDQFASYAAGRFTGTELQHVAECSECGAELERFANTLSSFRSAIRDRIDDRVASQAPAFLLPVFSASRAILGSPKWRWAMAAVVILVVLLLPFTATEKKPQEGISQTAALPDANALMDAVNLHLSRTMPAPMEPIIALMPDDQSAIQPGGIQ